MIGIQKPKSQKQTQLKLERELSKQQWRNNAATGLSIPESNRTPKWVRKVTSGKC